MALNFFQYLLSLEFFSIAFRTPFKLANQFNVFFFLCYRTVISRSCFFYFLFHHDWFWDSLKIRLNLWFFLVEIKLFKRFVTQKGFISEMRTWFDWNRIWEGFFFLFYLKFDRLGINSRRSLRFFQKLDLKGVWITFETY